MEIYQRTAANRRLLADFFDSLDRDQLDVRSLCPAWTVREVLGHLVMPLVGGLGSLAWAMVRHGGSVNGASEAIARDLARRPVPELTGLLRERSNQRRRAPGVGPMGQMSDGCIHLRDCARPLGLTDDVEAEDWRLVLQWLTGGVPGLVPRGRLRGLSFEATDQDWTWGSGDRVAGSSEALALAITGRAAVVPELGGDGVDLLGRRIGGVFQP